MTVLLKLGVTLALFCVFLDLVRLTRRLRLPGASNAWGSTFLWLVWVVFATFTFFVVIPLWAMP